MMSTFFLYQTVLISRFMLFATTRIVNCKGQSFISVLSVVVKGTECCLWYSGLGMYGKEGV